ncbi:hypothetical protein Ddye_003417 [Dipteronia dyeriana]|uniref:Fe2OG dioxygenase domain-containing protein n=1 Tax=Dipteronia dyeriana TaxID=168575 RepID=A0AAE0CVY7_9ROSI|nr:hypothetical protein Ddye_003417 [Dipteronia dyeriana]
MEKNIECFHEATFIDQDGHPRTTRVPVVQELARSEPDDEGRVEELAKLASVAKEWGLFLVTEHGIGSDMLNGVKDVVKGFFALSFQEKKQCVGSYVSVDNMGYGRNFVKSEDQPQAIENYVEEARNVLDELLIALAEALALESHVFLRHFDSNNSEINVRINYYPPCPKPDLALGLTPHTDASALTLLMQFETTGGLQILKDRKWLTVPWTDDALLVNVGDLLEIMSNGRLKSPWHRVVTQMNVERFSVALFYNPPSRAEIDPEPIEDLVHEYEGFKKVVVSEYLQHFYAISPTKEKQAIMYAKVMKQTPFGLRETERDNFDKWDKWMKIGNDGVKTGCPDLLGIRLRPVGLMGHARHNLLGRQTMSGQLIWEGGLGLCQAVHRAGLWGAGLVGRAWPAYRPHHLGPAWHAILTGFGPTF